MWFEWTAQKLPLTMESIYGCKVQRNHQQFITMVTPKLDLYSISDMLRIVESRIGKIYVKMVRYLLTTQKARFMWPTWGPPGSCRPQLSPMLAPWALLSGNLSLSELRHRYFVCLGFLLFFAYRINKLLFSWNLVDNSVPWYFSLPFGDQLKISGNIREYQFIELWSAW